MDFPLDRDTVRRMADAETFELRHASIREMNRLVNSIESEFSMRFVRMEFGVPGLPTHPIAIEARIQGAARVESSYGHVATRRMETPACDHRFPVGLQREPVEPRQLLQEFLGLRSGCPSGDSFASGGLLHPAVGSRVRR